MARRDRGQLFAGAGAMLLGLLLMVMVIGDPAFMSEGVPLWIGVAAGGVFFLAGVLVLRSATKGGPVGDIVNTTLVAVLVSAFAAVSMIFPPSGILVGYFAVLCWILVYRRVHERVTGRDPLGGWSDRKQLGLGCLVTITLILAVILVAWLVTHRPLPELLLPERMPGEAR